MDDKKARIAMIKNLSTDIANKMSSEILKNMK
jgi:hypothetical protein